MRRCLLTVVLSLLALNTNAAVIFDSLRIDYSDIYSSYIELDFDNSTYNDGSFIITGPASVFTNVQYGGLINSLTSWQIELYVSGDTASINTMSWHGHDSSISSIRGDLNTIKNYNGWNIGNGSYNFYYSVAPSVPEVPIPSAVWLFGSGLIGLIGIARRKANA